MKKKEYNNLKGCEILSKLLTCSINQALPNPFTFLQQEMQMFTQSIGVLL